MAVRLYARQLNLLKFYAEGCKFPIRRNFHCTNLSFLLISSNKFGCRHVSNVFKSDVENNLYKDGLLDKEEEGVEESAEDVDILKGRAATQLQEEILKGFIESNDELTDERWDRMRASILRIEYGIFSSPNKINSKIIDTCAAMNNLPKGRNFLSYLIRKKEKLTVGFLNNYLKMCYLCSESCQEEDIKRILKICHEVMKKKPVLDTLTSRALICGLSLTNEWEKCYEIIQATEERENPGSFAIGALIRAAIRNSQYDKACHLLTKSLTTFTPLDEKVYKDWIKYFRDDAQKITKLLEILSHFEIILPHTVCIQLTQAYSKFPKENNLQGQFTCITTNGVCMRCREPLKPTTITHEEFEELKSVFVERALIRQDVFCNSTPGEVKNFTNFVKKTGPYEIVIDGLNISLMAGRHKNPAQSYHMLLSVVKHFVKTGQKKILIVGRKHLAKKWPPGVLSNLRNLATLYLVDDISQDDPFLIYATMYSGMGCCFISRDFMRNHKVVLNDERLCNLFKMWQRSHQWIIKYIEDNGKVHLYDMVNYQINIQKRSTKGWHIPYIMDDDVITDSYTYHRDWLCLK